MKISQLNKPRQCWGFLTGNSVDRHQEGGKISKTVCRVFSACLYVYSSKGNSQLSLTLRRSVYIGKARIYWCKTSKAPFLCWPLVTNRMPRIFVFYRNIILDLDMNHIYHLSHPHNFTQTHGQVTQSWDWQQDCITLSFWFSLLFVSKPQRRCYRFTERFAVVGCPSMHLPIDKWPAKCLKCFYCLCLPSANYAFCLWFYCRLKSIATNN